MMYYIPVRTDAVQFRPPQTGEELADILLLISVAKAANPGNYQPGDIRAILTRAALELAGDRAPFAPDREGEDWFGAEPRAWLKDNSMWGGLGPAWDSLQDAARKAERELRLFKGRPYSPRVRNTQGEINRYYGRAHLLRLAVTDPTRAVREKWGWGRLQEAIEGLSQQIPGYVERVWAVLRDGRLKKHCVGALWEVDHA